MLCVQGSTKLGEDSLRLERGKCERSKALQPAKQMMPYTVSKPNSQNHFRSFWFTNSEGSDVLRAVLIWGKRDGVTVVNFRSSLHRITPQCKRFRTFQTQFVWRLQNCTSEPMSSTDSIHSLISCITQVIFLQPPVSSSILISSSKTRMLSFFFFWFLFGKPEEKSATLYRMAQTGEFWDKLCEKKKSKAKADVKGQEQSKVMKQRDNTWAQNKGQGTTCLWQHAKRSADECSVWRW